MWCLAGCDKTFGLLYVGPAPIDAPLDDGPVDMPVDGPVDGAVDGPVDAPRACPATYSLMIGSSNSRYRHIALDAPWNTAQTLCLNDEMGITRHTHLVVLSNETERTQLFAALKTAGLTKNVWIGLTDIKNEGTFRWVTAQSVGVPPNGQNPPWAAGQPDNNSTTPGGQDCVRMIAPNAMDEGRYDDVEGIANFELVCECDDFPAVPANYMP